MSTWNSKGGDLGATTLSWIATALKEGVLPVVDAAPLLALAKAARLFWFGMAQAKLKSQSLLGELTQSLSSSGFSGVGHLLVVKLCTECLRANFVPFHSRW